VSRIAWGGLGLLVALLGTPSAARGEGYDFDLSRFGSVQSGVLQGDQAGFENFAGDLGLALHPKFAGPASSVGGLGIEFGYQLSLSDINETAKYWTDVAGQPDPVMLVSHLYVRKGLPYSFELGGVLTHVHDSSVWAVGLELKYAIFEGHQYIPDLGLRAHVNTMLGNRDLVMITTGGEAVLSKTFGVAGLLELTPWIGVEVTYIHGRSHVLGVFPEAGLEPETFILDPADLARVRALLGLRVVASVVDLGFETAIAEMSSFTFKMGVQF
jgi:hypothetical protein